MKRKSGIILAILIVVLGSAMNFVNPYSTYQVPDKEKSSFDVYSGQIIIAFKPASGYVAVWEQELSKRTLWGRVLLQEAGILILGGVFFPWSRKKSSEEVFE